ncbi:hypothetical protein MRB56_09290 [Halomonas cupida]|uniref:hypothetical protein n=1 Tax=Halomonas cupida TaxID=44933 RepID=UPI0039B49881
MKALERTQYDMRIGDARHGNVTIGGRQKQGPCKPSIAGEARVRGIPEGAVHRFLKLFPEHRGKPPAMICDLHEKYEAERPETYTAAAARHGIEYQSLSDFRRKHKLQDLAPEDLCQRYRDHNERMEA